MYHLSAFRPFLSRSIQSPSSFNPRFSALAEEVGDKVTLKYASKTAPEQEQPDPNHSTAEVDTLGDKLLEEPDQSEIRVLDKEITPETVAAATISSDVNSKDPLQRYLFEISQIPLLTREEEHKLGLLCLVQDDKGTAKKAKEKIIRANLRLVVFMAKKYRGASHLKLLDLIQHGNLGLMHAANKFDPTLGTKFASYAGYWIRAFIKRGLLDEEKTIRTPVHIADLGYKILPTVKTLWNELHRYPTVEEISAQTGISSEKVEAYFRSVAHTGSLQGSLDNGDDGYELQDRTPDESTSAADACIESNDIKRVVLASLKMLPQREREILEMRFGIRDLEEQTLASIGKDRDLSRERIRQLEAKALRSLRHFRELQLLASTLDREPKALQKSVKPKATKKKGKTDKGSAV